MHQNELLVFKMSEVYANEGKIGLKGLNKSRYAKQEVILMHKADINTKIVSLDKMIK